MILEPLVRTPLPSGPTAPAARVVFASPKACVRRSAASPVVSMSRRNDPKVVPWDQAFRLMLLEQFAAVFGRFTARGGYPIRELDHTVALTGRPAMVPGRLFHHPTYQEPWSGFGGPMPPRRLLASRLHWDGPEVVAVFRSRVIRLVPVTAVTLRTLKGGCPSFVRSGNGCPSSVSCVRSAFRRHKARLPLDGGCLPTRRLGSQSSQDSEEFMTAVKPGVSSLGSHPRRISRLGLTFASDNQQW
jgi:hypothetical protein